MSADLIAQLAEYGQFLRAEQEPIGVSEIVLRGAVPPSDDVTWSPPDVAGRRRRGVVVLAAAAVIVLFVGGLVWVSRSDVGLRDVDQPPVMTDSPATTKPATTTPNTTSPNTTTPNTTTPAVTLGAPGVASGVTTVATLDARPHIGTGMFVDTGDAVWLHTFGEDESSELETSVIVRIDIASHAVEKISVDGIAGKMVPTADALWVGTTYNGGTLVRIDLRTRTITDVLEVAGVSQCCMDIIAADGGLWVTGSTSGYLRVDLATHAIEIYPGDGDFGNEVGAADAGLWAYRGDWVGEIDGGLWVFAGGLTRIDLDTGGVERYEFDFGTADRYAVAAGDSIWLTSWDGSVARFDLESREITDRLDIGGGDPGIGGGGLSEGHFADQAVWVVDHGVGTITRIDATTAEVTDVISIEPEPGTALSFLAGSLWVAHIDTGVISRVDIATRQVSEVIAAGIGSGQPLDPPTLAVLLAVPADDALWIAATDRTVQRIAIEP